MEYLDMMGEADTAAAKVKAVKMGQTAKTELMAHKAHKGHKERAGKMV